MLQRRRTSTVIALFAIVACGPPRLGPGSDGDETGSSSDATTASETSTSTSTSTTDTETSDTETSTDSRTTAEFVPREDTLLANQCDPWLQDCPEGEKCVPYASSGSNWDANKCVPIMGDAEPGEPCWYGGPAEATDDCDGTGICWDVMEIDGEPIGVCHSFCTGTPDSPECPPAASCLISGDGPISICVYSCDPLLQDCGSGLACYWANNQFNCVFTTQDLPAGEPCGFINDCALGNTCVATEALPSCEGSACCTPFCDIELGDQQCEAMPGTSCVPFFEEGQAPPGYERLGLCTLP